MKEIKATMSYNEQIDNVRKVTDGSDTVSQQRKSKRTKFSLSKPPSVAWCGMCLDLSH